MKLLFTAGATREPIDGVRFITNFSTGRTGAGLVDELSERGWQITALCGQGALTPQRADNVITFRSFNDLDGKLKSELGSGSYAAIVHLAAVSDYCVSEIVIGNHRFKPEQLSKIPSSTPELELKLTRNFKIVDRLKSYAKDPLFVVAFKLTNRAPASERHEAVAKLLSSPNIDLVVHNDLSEIGLDGNRRFTIYGKSVEPTTRHSVQELGTLLHEHFRRIFL